MLRESHELRHGAQCLVQAVEWIAAAASACRQSKTVQRAIDAAVIGEVQ